ncbi:MAG TPA: DUF3164 family protein [Desulfuromonadaceae bacterium]
MTKQDTKAQDHFYSYAPQTGMQYHATKEAAKEAAGAALRQLNHNGITGPDVETVTWGEIRERAAAEDGAPAVLRNNLRLCYEREHPQVVDGKMHDSQGNLILLRNIHETDLMYHDLVLTVAAIWKDMSAKIARFKQHNFEDVTAVLDLLFEKYQIERGGRDGNMQFFTFDRRYKLAIAIQKKIDFGPELQAAEAKLQEALNEMATAETGDLHTLVTAAFNLDGGKVRVAEILRLRRYKIANELWNEAMRIIDQAILVISSKRQIRLYERNPAGEYINIPLDIAAL